MSPEEMIRRAQSPDYDGTYGADLYSAFCSGFPIENLRPLLTSPLPRTRSLGCYLAYELGWPVHPFVPELTDLLNDPHPQNRSDTMIALRACTTRDDGEALGHVLLRLGDEDPFVQRGAMRFVQLCQRWQLRLALKNAANADPPSIFGELQHVAQWRPITKDLIECLLAHPDKIAKRLGVGLAARPRLIVDETFLDIAANYDDAECANIVKWARERPLPIYAELRRLDA